MQDSRPSTDTQPWYRQFWPWFIMMPPLVAIVASLYTIWIAVENAPDLVVPDYARIAETAEQDRQLGLAANELGLEARVQLLQLDGSDNRAISMILTATDSSRSLPNEVLLKLIHGTKPEFDRTILLVNDGERYRGAVDIPASNYTLQLEDTELTWRLSGRH